ncbi:non-homologous end-joining DNA ligase [Roseomonas gilardii subsp. gilardii]|uniref:non-homologous end-joining DNA ligase n=1 Tax=Roseomonas gilardii TaxID=257708 RepID=UPI001FFA7B89|nr:non-homologous end-joining DNA ligase [Roseomonas gilardii]UPG72805.1 non-homologous end-joining DNA ligase [Roseomonas gilardii subsp. gilardii]
MAEPAPLASYRRKRDFRRTPEPAGAEPRAHAGGGLFVVQKHDATRLHYDFRLEMGGVLKSWAVTRGPSLDPEQKRLAVEVEDHPIEYGGFEGQIGSGYGAGTVMLWDRGRWEPLSDDPEEELAKGRLHFRLHGQRLKGDWHLVLMRSRGTRRNWLLIKDRDDEARPGSGDALLEDATTSIVSGRDLAGIAGGAPPRPGKTPKPRREPLEDAPPEGGRSRKRSVTASRRTGTMPSPEDGRGGVRSPRVAGVVLTHPERIYWPASGDEEPVTKHGLALYLEKVAPRLLPAIAGRPLTLVRAPEGIEGARFVQRHAARGLSPLVGTVRPRGEERPLIQVDSVESLMALAQSGVLEIHPWGARSVRLAQPDRMVLDLDPAEGLPFDAVVAAALALRERLLALDLVPFCKTTGGKGLHVVVPLAAGARWDRLHAVAEAICEGLARAAPERFTTQSALAGRKGRIFLDFQRNARGASAVAPWSPRARPGAPVAMPLGWEEVKEGLDPRHFTIATAPARLEAPDPWGGMEAAVRPLPPLQRLR